MISMRYISRVAAGYLVRKVTNGVPSQGFFGDTRFGSKEKALEHAIEYRDKLLTSTQGELSIQSKNIRNITGIVGVSWHCRPNPRGAGLFIHYFRAQAPVGEPGKSPSKTWSVQRYGLLTAYEQAYRWRNLMAKGMKSEEKDIHERFTLFLQQYIKQMELRDQREPELREALTLMTLDPNTPRNILANVHSLTRRLRDPGREVITPSIKTELGNLKAGLTKKGSAAIDRTNEAKTSKVSKERKELTV